MGLKLFQALNYINGRLSNIEKRIEEMNEKLDFSVALQRNHLIRVKNNENIDDTMILMGRPYNDHSPEDAYKIYSNKDNDFILLDVSHESYTPQTELKGSIKIPYESLMTRYPEIMNKTTPILIISEKGLRSILACEFLIKKGFFNLNNISGGHQFWPENVEEDDSISNLKVS